MWENFKAFWAEPFKREMDAVDWFLFIGMLLIILILWRIILRHIQDVAD